MEREKRARKLAVCMVLIVIAIIKLKQFPIMIVWFGHESYYLRES